MAINPLGHRLSIRPDKLEDDKQYKSASSLGIIIPKDDAARARELSIDRGTVLEIGQSAFADFHTEPWCQPGDYIAYARHAGKWVTDPETDEEILIINDEDVCCRITPKPNKDLT